MVIPNSDRDWEAFGQRDPYYGVISHTEYKGHHLDEETRARFFASGEQHVDLVVGAIIRHVDPDFAPTQCLDFGCGVGRVVLSLAKRYPHVVGVDISSTMLEEARANSTRYGVNNVEWVISDDTLARVTDTFDFIHCFIVLQHIPVRRGEAIIARLLDMLNAGGIAMLHVTYAWDMRRTSKINFWIRQSVPFGHAALNVLKGKPAGDPFMQMNNYSLVRLMRLLHLGGYNDVHVQLTNHSGHLGAMLFVQRARVSGSHP